MTRYTNSVKEKPAVEKKETVKGEKKQGAIPFKGTVAQVDKEAKTLTVGEKTFQITSETKIKKAGKPATLADAVPGEEAGLSYTKGADGKLVALSVRLGPKVEGQETKAKKEKKNGTDKE